MTPQASVHSQSPLPQRMPMAWGSRWAHACCREYCSSDTKQWLAPVWSSTERWSWFSTIWLQSQVLPRGAFQPPQLVPRSNLRRRHNRASPWKLWHLLMRCGWIQDPSFPAWDCEYIGYLSLTIFQASSTAWVLIDQLLRPCDPSSPCFHNAKAIENQVLSAYQRTAKMQRRIVPACTKPHMDTQPQAKILPSKWKQILRRLDHSDAKWWGSFLLPFCNMFEQCVVSDGRWLFSFLKHSYSFCLQSIASDRSWLLLFYFSRIFHNASATTHFSSGTGRIHIDFRSFTSSWVPRTCA